MFYGKGRREWFIYIILTLTIMLPILIRWLVIKFKYNGQAIDPATGKPRKLGGKWSSIVGYSLFGLASCLFLVGSVMNVIDNAGISLLALLKAFNGVAFFMATVILILGLLHQKGKINVSYKLLIILTVIAIALSASVAGFVTLKDIPELTKLSVQTLLSSIAFSGLGLSFHKMRKK
jgi:hypothetical protein